jgi:hypothetical protein
VNLELFTNYYQDKMKSNLYINKRLRGIEEYFQDEHEITINFTSKEGCFTYIVNFINRNEDTAEEILGNLFYKIDSPYSSHNPYYLNTLKNSVAKEIFAENISRLFETDVIHGDFTYQLRDEGIEYDATAEIIHCELDFEETVFDYAFNERRRRELGTIKITFDLIYQKFITSECSNERSHKNIFDYIKMQGYDISPMYILKRASTIANRNSTDFSPTTILIINLLLDTLPSLGYRVTLDSINFTNDDSQDIQRMTLTGTNLLSTKVILQSIHNGDAVHTLKISLDIIENIDNEEFYFRTTFKIDLRGRLAFIFGDDDLNHSKNREICIKVQDSLMNLIYLADTIPKGVSLILASLPKPQSLTEILTTIQNDLLGVIEDVEAKDAIKGYFIDRHAIT